MIGRTVGRFRIVAKLGEGGMGSVWKAEDSLLGRSIALKFLPEALASQPEARRRFLREAQAASLLDHPGAATVYDAGEADGHVYIALQLVDGETLSDVIARGPLPVPEAIRIAASAAEALAHAHARGVLHRDISSRNIMLARDGRVVVVDFGLALPEGHTRLTETGTTMGTIAYMAPEVAQGGGADTRSDLYALGVVLYEMLTGTLPFAGERAEAALYATVHEPAQPPSQRRPGVPVEVDPVVLCALEKDPSSRYADCTLLAAALRGLEIGGDDRPVAAEASAAVLPKRLDGVSGYKRLRARPRTWVGLSVVVAAVALFLLAKEVPLPSISPRGIFSRLRPQKTFTSVAVLPLNNLSEDPSASDHLALGIAENLVTKLTKLTGLRVIPWITTQGYWDSSQTLTGAARELGVDALVVGTFEESAGKLSTSISLVDGKTGSVRWSDDFEEGRTELFTVERDIAVQLATSLKGELTGQEEHALAQTAARSAEAYEYYLRGALISQGGDLRSAEQAVELFEKALKLDPNLADAYVGIGAMLPFLTSGPPVGSDLKRAEECFHQALALDPTSASARRGLIHVYADAGRFEECLKQGQKVQRLGLEDAEHLLVRADAYHFGSLWDKADSLYRRVIELDPAERAAWAMLAINSGYLGNPRACIDAGEAFVRRFGADDDLQFSMAVAYHSLGDTARARAGYERAIGKDPQAMNGYHQLAILYRQMGQPERARQMLVLGIQALEPALKRDPNDWYTRGGIAILCAALGDKVRFAEEEARVLHDVPSDPAAGSVIWSHGFGCAHAMLGETAKAFELWRAGLRTGHRYHSSPPSPIIEGLEDLRGNPDLLQLTKEFAAAGARLRALY